MAQLLTTLVTGRAGGTAPASDLTDYIRLQEFNTFASGVSRPGHTHVAADIVDLTAATGLILAQVIGDSDTVVKILAGANPLLLSGLAVRLKAGGGILKDAQGLYLDPSGLSRPGHTHVLAEILDFDARLPDKLAAVLLDTNSVHWLELSGTLRANVREKVGGAILEDSGGIYVDLGSGVAQAARGNHTHADEHAPVTLGAPDPSLSLQLAGQQLTGAVILEPGGGLKADPSGVAVDFGAGHNQAMRGDFVAAHDHLPVTTQNTTSVALAVDPNQVLSGVAVLDPTPSAGRGKLGVGGAGLFVVLGPNPDQAAAGNHGHNVVTSTASGFMSPAMLAALGGFQSEADLRNGSLRIDLDGDGAALLSGVKAYAVMPYSGTVTGWDLAAPLSGGSLIIDVWRRPYAAFPPRAVDTMAGSELPTLVSGAINRDLSLTTWAVANGLVGYFDKEDVLAFYVMPGSTVKRANLQLRINRA